MRWLLRRRSLVASSMGRQAFVALLVATLLASCAPSAVRSERDRFTGVTTHRQEERVPIERGRAMSLAAVAFDPTGELCFVVSYSADARLFIHTVSFTFDEQTLEFPRSSSRDVGPSGRIIEAVAVCSIAPEEFAEFLHAARVVVRLYGREDVAVEVDEAVRRRFVPFFQRFVAFEG